MQLVCTLSELQTIAPGISDNPDAWLCRRNSCNEEHFVAPFCKSGGRVVVFIVAVV